MNNDSKEWVRKYAAASLDQVVGQTTVVAQLNMFSSSPLTLSNLLLYGPPGTGKSTCAKAYINQAYMIHTGKNHQIPSTFILQLNGSVQNGIDSVRGEIGTFVSNSSLHDAEFPVKFVVYEECDMLSKDAQSALRRVMDTWMSRVRFILLCNNESKIIPAIHSRCNRLRFRPLGVIHLTELLRRITLGEKLLGPMVHDSNLTLIVSNSKGDARTAISSLFALTSMDWKIGMDSLDQATHGKEIARYLQTTFAPTCISWLHSLIAAFENSEKANNSTPFALARYFYSNILQESSDLSAWIDVLFNEVIHRPSTYPFFVSWVCELSRARLACDLETDLWTNVCGLVGNLWNALERFRHADKVKKSTGDFSNVTPQTVETRQEGQEGR